MFKSKHCLWFASLSTLVLVQPLQAREVPGDAAAQDAPADDGAIAEIVVNARKTGAESIQKVPAAITAIPLDVAQMSQATSLVDIGRMAPNVQLQTAGSFPGFANFTIRGLSVNNSLRTLDPTVIVVTDGIAYGDPYGTLVDTFDLETIQVQRGPQGVLLGRNATGGAIVLQTRKPDDELRVQASLRVGNVGRFDQSFVVEGPLSDTVAAKLAVLRRRADGTSPDRNRGVIRPSPFNPSGLLPVNATGREVREDMLLIRPVITWRPSSEFDLTFIAERIDARFGGTNSRILSARPPLEDILGYTPFPYGYEIDHDTIGQSDLRSERLVLEANLDVGAGTVTAVSGYRHVAYISSIENDGVPYTLLHFPDNRNYSRQYSQELRFASSFSDRVQLLVGGYISRLEQTTDEKRIINTLLTSPLPPYRTVYLRGAYDQRSSNMSVFANIDWEALDGLTLSAGGRFTHEKKAIDVVPIAACPALDFSTCATAAYGVQRKWNDVSPRFAASYEVSDDALVYASWTKGFRSGNFNGRATSPAGIGPSRAESASSFEGGFKTTFLDRRVRLNGAIFYTKYDDIQKVLLNAQAVQSLFNAANATISGIELEATVKPVQALTLDGAFGYTRARYDSFDGLDLTGDGVPDPELARKLRFERVPKITATGGATVEFDLGDLGDLAVRGSYSYFSHQFTDLVNTQQTAVGAYGLFNASATWSPNEWLTITAYGRNIGKAKYFDASLALRWAYLGFGGEGRTYGIEFAADF